MLHHALFPCGTRVEIRLVRGWAPAAVKRPTGRHILLGECLHPRAGLPPRDASLCAEVSAALYGWFSIGAGASSIEMSCWRRCPARLLERTARDHTGARPSHQRRDHGRAARRRRARHVPALMGVRRPQRASPVQSSAGSRSWIASSSSNGPCHRSTNCPTRYCSTSSRASNQRRTCCR
jgi:hypothetical protein